MTRREYDRETSLDARLDVDLDLEPRVADFGEPVPPLVDEVEREPVRPRPERRAHVEPLPRRSSRLDRARDRCPDLAPDDRVAAVVEPVVRDLDSPPRRA